MSNQYRAVHPSIVALRGEDVFEDEFTADEEADLLGRHHVELVPRPYRVLSDNYTLEGHPVPVGEVITVAFPVEIEAALLAGGHLERVRRDANPTVELDPVTGELADPADVHPVKKSSAAKKRTTATKEK